MAVRQLRKSAFKACLHLSQQKRRVLLLSVPEPMAGTAFSHGSSTDKIGMSACFIRAVTEIECKFLSTIFKSRGGS